jgi:hypothetical protein
MQVEVTGDWKTVSEGKTSREVITPLPAKKAEQRSTENHSRTESVDVSSGGGEPFNGSPLPVVAPIRTTSPGLTVYRGGAFVPRYVDTRQQLGGLKVDRHTLLLGFSYTPTPRIQVEAEIPVTRISYRNAATSASGAGIGQYHRLRKVSLLSTGRGMGRPSSGIALRSGTSDWQRRRSERRTTACPGISCASSLRRSVAVFHCTLT